MYKNGNGESNHRSITMQKCTSWNSLKEKFIVENVGLEIAAYALPEDENNAIQTPVFVLIPVKSVFPSIDMSLLIFTFVFNLVL